MYALTEREEEVASLVFLGKTNRQIAEALYISLPTVKSHLQKAFLKTKSKSRVDLSRAWLECTFHIRFRRCPSNNKLKIIRNLNTERNDKTKCTDSV